MDKLYGVWSCQDRIFCCGTIGTKESAEAELPRWQSGEAAEVNPHDFTYEVREVPDGTNPYNVNRSF